jgi:hypothetical protein
MFEPGVKSPIFCSAALRRLMYTAISLLERIPQIILGNNIIEPQKSTHLLSLFLERVFTLKRDLDFPVTCNLRGRNT